MNTPDDPSSAPSSEVAILVGSSTANPTPVRAGEHRHRNEAAHGIDTYTFPSETSLSSPNPCKKHLRKRLPILKWLPNYKVKTDLLPDAVAGVTVGLTAIPQSIAYASVAGLTPEYGLYSSFISCFVYLFLGSCRQMNIGPTALVELLVYETCGPEFPCCVVLIGFWMGVIQFAMGLLKLGAVVSLISDPVTIGFVAGASLTISSSQIKSFLGLSGPKGSGFIGYIKSAIENIGTARVGDTCLGVACVIILLLFKNLKDYWKPSTDTTRGRVIVKCLWLLAMGRNAIVVIAASAIAASFPEDDNPFVLTGSVKSGFPPVAPPPFELPPFTVNDMEQSVSCVNGTTMTFWETWGEIKTAPLMIAIISILQNVAIAKAFGSGQSIDATQEMIALGVSHICASFFSAMPTAGSFTRSAVNEASGVKSPIGGIFTGLLVIFALSFLTKWFAYIPKASLAAVILCAVLPMIEYESIFPMWRISKLDVLTTLVTFLASALLGMEYGIIIGVGTSLALYLVRPVRPRVAWSLVNVGDNAYSEAVTATPSDRTVNEEYSTEGIDKPSTIVRSLKSEAPPAIIYHLVRPEQGFMFPSVDAIRTTINKLALKYPNVKFIALDCRNMISIDYTSASALCSLVNALKKNGKTLVFIQFKEDWIELLKTVGMKKVECYNDLHDFEKHLLEE